MVTAVVQYHGVNIEAKTKNHKESNKNTKRWTFLSRYFFDFFNRHFCKPYKKFRSYVQEQYETNIQIDTNVQCT